jgi:hypothetical protein
MHELETQLENLADARAGEVAPTTAAGAVANNAGHTGHRARWWVAAAAVVAVVVGVVAVGFGGGSSDDESFVSQVEENSAVLSGLVHYDAVGSSAAGVGLRQGNDPSQIDSLVSDPAAIAYLVDGLLVAYQLGDYASGSREGPIEVLGPDTRTTIGDETGPVKLLDAAIVDGSATVLLSGPLPEVDGVRLLAVDVESGEVTDIGPSEGANPVTEARIGEGTITVLREGLEPVVELWDWSGEVVGDFILPTDRQFTVSGVEGVSVIQDGQDVSVALAWDGLADNEVEYDDIDWGQVKNGSVVLGDGPCVYAETLDGLLYCSQADGTPWHYGQDEDLEGYRTLEPEDGFVEGIVTRGGRIGSRTWSDDGPYCLVPDLSTLLEVVASETYDLNQDGEVDSELIVYVDDGVVAIRNREGSKYSYPMWLPELPVEAVDNVEFGPAKLITETDPERNQTVLERNVRFIGHGSATLGQGFDASASDAGCFIYLESWAAE